MSLPLRNRAQTNDDFTVDIELDVRGLRLAGIRRVRVHNAGLSEVIGAGIERGANTEPDHAAFGGGVLLLALPRVPMYEIFGDFEHLRIIARIVDASIGSRVGK